MKGTVAKLISEQKHSTVTVITIEKRVKKLNRNIVGHLFYKELAEVFLALESDGIVVPMKSAKVYSRDPRIRDKYKKVVEKENNEELKLEMMTKFHSSISISNYLSDIVQYEKDKEYLMRISDFLSNAIYSEGAKQGEISINERSYELFGDEKFLDSPQGRKILMTIKIGINELKCYKTYEPFFYYGMVSGPSGNILIVENKDTFYSFKKLFLDGVVKWKNIRFSMLIYGEGNKINKSIDYLSEIGVPCTVNIYYFGDLDPEGINIYYRLSQNKKYDIRPMELYYRTMFDRRKGGLVKNKQTWNQSAMNDFFEKISFKDEQAVKEYLAFGLYVPQEALNIEVLRRITNGQGDQRNI